MVGGGAWGLLVLKFYMGLIGQPPPSYLPPDQSQSICWLERALKRINPHKQVHKALCHARDSAILIKPVWLIWYLSPVVMFKIQTGTRFSKFLQSRGTSTCGAPAALAPLRLCGERGWSGVQGLAQGPFRYLAFELNLRFFFFWTRRRAWKRTHGRAAVCTKTTRAAYAHTTSLRHCKSSEECVLNAGFIFTQQYKLTGIN